MGPESIQMIPNDSKTGFVPGEDSMGSAFAIFIGLAICLMVWGAGSRSDIPVLWWTVACGIFGLLFSKCDYLNPLPAFLFPWMAITLFATLELSQFARPLSGKTYGMVWGIELSALVTYYLAAHKKPRRQSKSKRETVSSGKLRALVALYALLTIFNVVAAGYVPLIRGIQTGDTAYLDFGIHGIFGFYNAFANALGLLSYFAFLQTGRKLYLYICLLICLVFVLFVTRQNLLSMLIQCTILHCLMRGRISWKKLAAGVAVMLVVFSVAGQLRSGNIKEIAGIKDEYLGLPDPVIWIYAYSYFNVLNLDVVVINPRVPFYDGSSLVNLLPSFMRPAISHAGDEIDVSELNVSSYVAPIYQDVGFLGTVVFTCGVMWWSVRSYQHALQDGSFYSVSKYSVLFFCALFSFFVNLWLYLPIIFEIPILAWMSKYILVPETSESQRRTPPENERRIPVDDGPCEA
jgi:oligosaccharide repeat unit polymerase